MSHSNTSLNLFTSCMQAYYQQQVLHSKPCQPPSPHLTFGAMAHEVLYRAGKLRDDSYDGVIGPNEYRMVIPSDVLYPELKQEFQIKSWERYFVPIIKRIAKYESEICQSCKNYTIEREVKLQLLPEEVKAIFHKTISQPLVGIIDFLVLGEDYAIILDYKFSTKRKTQDDFDMNSQLYLYAMLVSVLFHISMRNIQIGYIDIPKVSFDDPVQLSNGTLSRSKNQNVLQECYKQAVIDLHGNDEKYNCDPGGYYYDTWCNLALNDVAYLTIQYLDESICKSIVNDLLDTASLIDMLKDRHVTFPRKHDSYSCPNCAYLDSCKPWLFEKECDKKHECADCL